MRIFSAATCMCFTSDPGAVSHTKQVKVMIRHLGDREIKKKKNPGYSLSCFYDPKINKRSQQGNGRLFEQSQIYLFILFICLFWLSLLLGVTVRVRGRLT